MINLIFGGVSGFQTRLRPRHGVPAIFAASCHPRTWPVVVAACQQAHHPGSDAKLANDRKEPVALANKGLRLRHSYARVTRNRADYLGRIIRETSQIAGDDCRPARPEGLWGSPMSNASVVDGRDKPQLLQEMLHAIANALIGTDLQSLRPIRAKKPSPARF